MPAARGHAWPLDGSRPFYPSGFMVNRVEGEAAYDFLVDVASQADLAILPVGCPTAVCGEHLLAHLPDELRDDVVVVRTGADLLDVITTA